MPRYLIALAFLLVLAFSGVARASCPDTLTDCPNINANNGSFGGQVITMPGISSTYTASGAIALTDKLSKLSCAAACTMTVAASTTAGQTLQLNNYGTTTTTISASLQGAPGTIMLPGNSGASVNLWWDAADATWLVQ